MQNNESSVTDETTNTNETSSQSKSEELVLDNPEALLEAFEKAKQEAQKNHEAYLRALADIENTRRRAHEDVQKAYKFAIEGFAEGLLPVRDALEAALSDQSGDHAKLKEGVELTLKNLENAFEKGKIQAINPVGEKFDPHKHQSISMVPATSEIAANHVVQVLQKGYMLSERVMRPALVIVAQ